MNTAAAILHARATAAMIEAIGMLSENLNRLNNGDGAAHGDDEFGELLDRYGLVDEVLSRGDLVSLLAAAVSVAETAKPDRVTGIAQDITAHRIANAIFALERVEPENIFAANARALAILQGSEDAAVSVAKTAETTKKGPLFEMKAEGYVNGRTLTIPFEDVVDLVQDEIRRLEGLPIHVATPTGRRYRISNEGDLRRFTEKEGSRLKTSNTTDAHGALFHGKDEAFERHSIIQKEWHPVVFEDMEPGNVIRKAREPALHFTVKAAHLDSDPPSFEVDPIENSTRSKEPRTPQGPTIDRLQGKVETLENRLDGQARPVYCDTCREILVRYNGGLMCPRCVVRRARDLQEEAELLNSLIDKTTAKEFVEREEKGREAAENKAASLQGVIDTVDRVLRRPDVRSIHASRAIAIENLINRHERRVACLEEDKEELGRQVRELQKELGAADKEQVERTRVAIQHWATAYDALGDEGDGLDNVRNYEHCSQQLRAALRDGERI